MAGKVIGRPRKNMDDLVGMRFGRLEVIRHSHNWYDMTAGGYRLRHSYLCKCDCGNLFIARRQCLTSGDTKSCGCLRTKERNKRK